MEGLLAHSARASAASRFKRSERCAQDRMRLTEGRRSEEKGNAGGSGQMMGRQVSTSARSAWSESLLWARQSTAMRTHPGEEDQPQEACTW
jgi:hypothetical protein